jgi:hypothetical protein
MPSSVAFKRFGRPEVFAIDLRAMPDPDGDAQAPTASIRSWGQWRMWVRGLNLTEHTLTEANGRAERRDAVTWYLAPLLRWIAANWTPLLHEERLPGLVRRAQNARAAYVSMLTSRMDDTEAFAPWQDWAVRHSLRWAAEGGILPDVFMRRVGDDIEVTWGPRWQPGAQAGDFTMEAGTAHASVAAVSSALDGMLGWARDVPQWAACDWFKAFLASMERRPTASDSDRCLSWYLDAAPTPGVLTGMYHRVRQQLANVRLSADAVVHHAVPTLAPAVAMFGALSPNMQESAIATLLAAVDGLQGVANAPLLIDEMQEDRPAWRSPHPWDDGYDLALTLLDDMEIDPSAAPVDLDGMLERLGVVRRGVHLSADGPLGVAIAGNGLCPAILVNEDNPINQSMPGRRFTEAHELCHLLFDRGQARSLAHSSTPWAPVCVEQRANAFAAMLLMPPQAIRRHWRRNGGTVSLRSVQEVAATMRVGLRAAIQHFANLGEITDQERDLLLDEVIGVPAPKGRKSKSHG